MIPQVDGGQSDPDSDDDEHEKCNENNGINGMNHENEIRCLLTNARSLMPKMDSMIDAFRSLDLNFASITETWFRGGKALANKLTEVEGSSGIKILHRSRDGRIKKTGGGVALAFNMGNCNFKNRHLKHVDKQFEVMCATGSVGKIPRRVVVFVIYVPPSTRVAEVAKLKEAIGAEITSVRRAFKNPIIIVNGDLNHRDFADCLDEVGEFSVLPTGPTRGQNTIDVIHSNIQDCISESWTVPPLQAANGALSDHRCVVAVAKFPKERGYEWKIAWRRSRNANSEAAFTEEMKNRDWTDIKGDSDMMAEKLEEVIGALTDKYFPLVRIRKRSSEHPWITKTIRRLWKKKIRIYKKGGRNDAWWRTEELLQSKIQEARNGFVDRILEDGAQGRSFYAAAKSLSAPVPSNKWQVSDLFPGQEAAKVGSEVLKFYSSISTDPIRPPFPVDRCDGGMGHFSTDRVSELLRKAKKTDSRVDGDPLAHLVRLHPEAFAQPVARIYNEINNSGKWPSKWKTEHLTIIPKNPNPSDLSECRNISCTSIFSKVLEGVVLLRLREEIAIDETQYGGVPKCGAEHMLVDIWERILVALEGGRNSAVLLGVDYEKAFNRMDHAVCLQQLQLLGASPGSLSLVQSFLEGRTMTIKVDGCSAEPVAIDKGSPQGSVLGHLDSWDVGGGIDLVPVRFLLVQRSATRMMYDKS